MKSTPILPGDPARRAVCVLPSHLHRWRGRSEFVVLETGFGSGDAFLATWRAWRDDSQRSRRLIYIAIEPRPWSRDDFVHAVHPAGTEPLADALHAAWPPRVHTLHVLPFDDDRVRVMLAYGEVRAWLPELVAEVDAFLVGDPGDGPDRDPVRRAKAYARLAARGATLVAAADDDLATGLRPAGFEITSTAPGALEARYEPHYTPRRTPPRWAGRDQVEPHALIIGAGLAGCSAAWALAANGWRSTVLDRQPTVAAEASGNPAGLFHGIVNAVDGIHARFNRAAALCATAEIRQALAAGVPGSVDGLLRLEHELDPTQMAAMLQRLGMPAEYVRACTRAEASALAGLALGSPAWHYPTGGWVAPAGLARHYLQRAGAAVDLRPGIQVARLVRGSDDRWQVWDEHGTCIATSPTVVLANACDALRLLGNPGWPLQSLRGQLSLARDPPFALPRMPVAGHGYLLPAPGRTAMFGATVQADDADPGVRDADHDHNLGQLERLLGHPSGLALRQLEGRTAWRCSAVDRLPLIGAVPEPEPEASTVRRDRTHLVPRRGGLYVYTGLGSRGIGWSALGARVLAAWVTGTPAPMEAGLLDAIDPARYALAGLPA